MSTATTLSPLPALLLLLLLAPPPSAADTSNVLEDSAAAATSRGGGGVGTDGDDDGDDDDRWQRTDLSRLSDGEVSAIPVARFRTLRADQLNGLGLRLRQALTQEQVAALTREQCRALQFGFLRGQQCAAISAECLRLIDGNARTLGARCVNYLTPEAVSALRVLLLQPDAFAGFGASALSNFSGAQCRDITPRAAVFLRSCRGLRRACLGRMHHASVGALQPACVRLLNPRSLLRLQGFYAALSREAFLAQTSAQLGSYGAEECAAFPRKVWPSLRTRQCANLTEECATELMRGAGGFLHGGDEDDDVECRDAIGARWPRLCAASAGWPRKQNGRPVGNRGECRIPNELVQLVRRRPRPSDTTANMPGLVVLVAVLVLAVHLLRRRRVRAADADADAASPSTGGEDAVHGRKTRREAPQRQQYQEL